MDLKSYIQSKKATLLCAGPMSKNCIDAVLEISDTYQIPQVLIASRRQVDAAEFGGGYVENFTTEAFAEYVNQRRSPLVLLARDHGGPWQSVAEQQANLSVEQAMASARKSFEVDILSGFDLIHIDPSVPIRGEVLTPEIILSRLLDLYGYLDDFAKSHGKKIAFELGTEEQDGYGQDLEKFEWFLSEVTRFCAKNSVSPPLFVVAQTGTKVMETQNVGDFDAVLPQIQKTLEICRKYNIFLKEHNTDYLSDEALALRPILGIHASNVAPEFGVMETKGLLYLMRIFGYQDAFDLFVETAFASQKWTKWMLPGTQATDLDRAIIAGHYVFGNPRIVEMKRELASKFLEQGIDLDHYLKTLIGQSMLRYCRLFRML